MYINIEKKDLIFGVTLGFKLARLEFIWGSDIPEAKEVFLPSVMELVGLLPKNLCADKSSYRAFSTSIINYYLREDIQILSAIMIGVCIQRSTLIGVSKDKEKDDIVKELARSSLRIIPSEIISDKEALFNKILANKQIFSEDLYSGIEILEMDDSCEEVEKEPDHYVFISYSSREVIEATRLRSFLEINGIRCWMAPDSIPSGSDYGECIPKAIANCSAFILVLSKLSQKSKWVPKELDCAITDNKVVIPFHIDNSQLINAFYFRLTNVQRIDAYKRSQKAYEELLNRIKSIIKIES